MISFFEQGGLGEIMSLAIFDKIQQSGEGSGKGVDCGAAVSVKHLKPHIHVSKGQSVFSSSQTSKPQFSPQVSQGSAAFSLIPSDIDGLIVSLLSEIG